MIVPTRWGADTAESENRQGDVPDAARLGILVHSIGHRRKPKALEVNLRGDEILVASVGGTRLRTAEIRGIIDAG